MGNNKTSICLKLYLWNFHIGFPHGGSCSTASKIPLSILINLCFKRPNSSFVIIHFNLLHEQILLVMNKIYNSKKKKKKKTLNWVDERVNGGKKRR